MGVGGYGWYWGKAGRKMVWKTSGKGVGVFVTQDTFRNIERPPGIQKSLTGKQKQRRNEKMESQRNLQKREYLLAEYLVQGIRMI